ncbi:hypothetical protein Nepgr_015135 [Nepenthes gracilis]|uniref:Secreted protein n=1 Tax=Nepenthes gracilis TaxID=150966 RepID=A0AAD3SMC6_NEPGR|nr:hypothetical protein Nepgr_015135 [Nepenthes gracilis]
MPIEIDLQLLFCCWSFASVRCFIAPPSLSTGNRTDLAIASSTDRLFASQRVLNLLWRVSGDHHHRCRKWGTAGGGWSCGVKKELAAGGG